MGLVAEYEVDCEHLPLVEVAAALPEATLTVDVGQPNQGGPPPFVVRVTGADGDAVERTFERTAFVDEYAVIERTARTDRYRVLPADTMDERLGRHLDEPERLRELAETHSVVERVEVTTAGWRQQRWFADRAAFDRYCAFWRDNGEAFRLLRLTPGEELLDAAPDDDLTDAQRTALRTAHEMGYFEVPRQASLDDVAAELGITASSLSERLRRAQGRLVETTVAATGAYKRPHGSGTVVARPGANR